MAFLIAPRLIDLGIFATLGGLWIFGVVFIVTLYRWIARYERETQAAETPSIAPAASAEAPIANPEFTADQAA